MFSFKKNNNGKNFPVIEEKKAAAGTYEVGDLLVVNASGQVAIAGSTDAPTFVCNADVTCASGDVIAVAPILNGHVYEATFSADGSALKAGAKVTTASGKYITATTASGVATLLTDGAASGKTALVEF